MTEVETAPAGRFLTDVMSPAFRENPYPAYESYRDGPALQRIQDTMWLCVRHEHVSTLMRRPELSPNTIRATSGLARPEVYELKARTLLFMDPPDHTRLRKLVSRAFTPKRVRELRPQIEAIAAELLDEMAIHGDSAEVDLVGSLAYPLPIRVICSLLGVPEADEPTFAHWSRALARLPDPWVLRTAEVDDAMLEAQGALASYIDGLIEERRSAPRDDLLSALLSAEAEGDRISSSEVVDLVVLLLVAGHETTVNLIANSVVALLEFPEQLQLLQQSPDLYAHAVDELLRFDSPGQITWRVATTDLDVDGHRVAAGEEIVLGLGAANRDPATFADPDRLDVRRDARQHVAFGGGIHHCLGAALARLEGEVALRSLFDRFPRLQLAGTPVRRATFTLRGFDSLPVALRDGL